MENVKQERKFLKAVVKGIAAQFGENCEVVLHDLTRQYDSTIVAIENGHVTGRKVGDPGTNLGLEVLRGTVEGGDKYNYITQTKTGKILRSTSIYINNEKNETIGSLCINFDITNLSMAEKTIQSLTSSNLTQEVKEDFATNVNELLDALLQETIEKVGKPVALMNKEDKIKGILYLDQRGAFLIKKAGDKITNFFDISKYTLYNYLEEGKKENQHI
ncbi:helix-turn-helix transcriptional regulator [Planococcus beigongshangi]|uniref:helix-turn-helix transcriptional regulator n=1 Tax=Planococcus beigongshangi TaxID=2782536 RepID=UPI00193B0E4F|nr:helix-turn-helix transcriptional regulator [Planococcus beigongshangi]